MLLALLYWFFAGLAWWMALHVLREIRSTQHWQTVMGTILERGVGVRMKGVAFSFLPYVKYSYSVTGKDYINDQVYLHKQTGSLDWQVRRLVNSLPNPVPVHYDPEYPERSYLIKNPMSIIWILVTVGALAFFVGFVELLQ